MSEVLTLAASADAMIVASPFCFADFQHFFEQLDERTPQLKRIEFITTLNPDEVAAKVAAFVSLQQLADARNIHVEIAVDPLLHGKVYAFQSGGRYTSAIITSANMTHNGLQRKHEWGCILDDGDQIAGVCAKIRSVVEYVVTKDMLQKLRHRVETYKGASRRSSGAEATINIDDIVLDGKYSIKVAPDVRIFIKPMGASEEPIYDGDFSQTDKQYFSNKRPNAVRQGDILIAYAVGARKIISAFQVQSDTPMRTDNETDRWPWYFVVKNMTPTLGKVWYEQNLSVTGIVEEYVTQYDMPATHVGGNSLGALQWGSDKVRLNAHCGAYVLSKVMTVEQQLYANHMKSED